MFPFEKNISKGKHFSNATSQCDYRIIFRFLFRLNFIIEIFILSPGLHDARHFRRLVDLPQHPRRRACVPPASVRLPRALRLLRHPPGRLHAIHDGVLPQGLLLRRH